MLRKTMGWALKHLNNKNIPKYLTIGIFMTVLTTFLMWLFVDIFSLLAVYVNPVINIAVFFFKFFAYNKIRMFNRNKYNFLKYVGVWLFLLILSTLILWLFVDLLDFWVVPVNILVVILMFILRFGLYGMVNILNNNPINTTLKN